MEAREWTPQISNAGLLPGNVRRELDDLIRSLAGKRVRIKLSIYQKKRSQNQNAYYWSVVIGAITQLFRENGNYVDAEDVHEFLKLRVGKLAQVIVLPDGEVVKGLGSTAKLSTIEMEVYLEKCRAFAAEYGVVIPLPNEESHTAAAPSTSL